MRYSRPRKWYGNPQVNVRFSREVAKGLKAAASAKNVPLSVFVRDHVNQWYRDVIAPTLPVALPSAAAFALPQVKQSRADTGLNETVKTLQEIDLERAKGGNAFVDG